MPSRPEHADLARAVARRLAGGLDTGLEMEVERILATGRHKGQPARFEAVAISLAALVVSVSQVAWQVYHDRKQSREMARESAAQEVVARRIRIQIDLPEGVTPETRDRVIGAVLQELDRQE